MKNEQTERLIAAAREVLRNAYAPYSNYRVGAALSDTSGGIHTAVNIENASYGLTVCAERNAVGKAVAGGSRHFRALALVSDRPPLPLPCGACRQVLAEFCSPEFPVYSLTPGRAEPAVYLLGELLPLAFRLDRPDTR